MLKCNTPPISEINREFRLKKLNSKIKILNFALGSPKTPFDNRTKYIELKKVLIEERQYLKTAKIAIV